MINWDHLQAGLAQAVAGTFTSPPVIVWAPSEYPRNDAGDLIALRVIAGPDPVGGRYESLGGAHALPTTLRVTCTNTADGKGIVACAGSWWTLDVEPAEAVDAYRDRWIELIQTPGYSINATVTAVDDDILELEGVDLWSLYGFDARGLCSYEVVESTPSKVKTLDMVVSCEVQCFSQIRYPRGGALSMASRLQASLELPDIYDILDSRGLSIFSMSSIVDLTTLSGAGWESRAAFTLSVGTRSFIARPIGLIEEPGGLFSIEGAGETIDLEF